MRVLMMPDYRAGNPYQQLLAQGLLEQNGQVEFPNGYRRGLPITRASLDHAPIDVLHLHWPGPYLRGQTWAVKAVYAVKLLVDLFCVRQQSIRIVWTVHNKVSHDTDVPELQRWVRRGVARLADRLIVHDEATRREVAETYRIPVAKVDVIPHGHYRTVYGESIPQEEARKQLGLTPNGRLFLNLGMLRPYKGLEHLLGVWPSYHQKHPGDALLIAGKALDHTYGRKLERRANNTEGVSLRVEFVPDEQIPVYFSAADLVVLPFEKITTSGSLLMALSYAKPVIAPRIGGIAEAVGPADALLYDPSASQGLLQAMERSQTVDLKALTDAARAACNRLDWDDIAEETAHVYQRAHMKEGHGL